MVEVYLEEENESGSISIYGETVRSYDVAILRKKAFQTVELNKDSINFTFLWNDQIFSFGGLLYGDVMVGSFISGKGISEMRMYRAERNNQNLDRYYGLYALEDDTCLITKREYGGLRKINMTNGISETLLEIREGHFTTRKLLLDKGTPVVVYRFPKDKGKKVIGLLSDNGNQQLFGRKLPLINQRVIKYNGFNAELEGTLFSPVNGESKTILILVHGSGPIYRTAFVEAAIQFTAMGYAAFVYDKRGSGTSSGSSRGDDFDLLAKDVIETLKMIEHLDSFEKIGFQGHSQAGYIIPLAIAMGADPDFTIIVNGGSISPGDQSIYDKTNDMVSAGYGQEEINEALSMLRAIHQYVINKSSDKSALEKQFLEAQQKPWFDLMDLPRMTAIPTWDDPPEDLLAFHDELIFDPLSNQLQMKCPTLVVLGENDKTVPSSVVRDLWQESGIEELEIVMLKNLGHDMRIQSGKGKKFSVEFIDTERKWLKRICN